MDYVTEKIWDAFKAGCVPIYYGSSNIKEIIPDPNAILLYDDYGMDAKKLAEAIKELMEDDDAYAKKMEWKNKTLEELSPSFQAYVKETSGPSFECKLCNKIAQDRVARKKAILKPFTDTFFEEEEELRTFTNTSEVESMN